MNKNFSICVYEFYKKNTTSVVFWQQHESVALLYNTLYNRVGFGINFFVRKLIRFRIYKTRGSECSETKRKKK